MELVNHVREEFSKWLRQNKTRGLERAQQAKKGDEEVY